MATPFVPRQAIRIDGAVLQELQGTVTEAVANDLVAKDVPPFHVDSVVHDNGCGYGAVTLGIMATDPPHGIQIHATDVNRMFISQLQSTVDENPSCLSDRTEAAKEIHRTLKLGGVAAIAVWEDVPWATAVEKAHRKTRGDDVPPGPFASKVIFQRNQLDKALKAGVARSDIKYIQKETWLSLGADMKRWASMVWSLGDIVKNEWHRSEDGVHKMRMVATIGIAQK